jgi:hypothetical protein
VLRGLADEAKAELSEALPALEAAIDSLKALNKNDIVEIKSFTKPPLLVQMTLEAVCILKQEKPDWDTVGTSSLHLSDSCCCFHKEPYCLKPLYSPACRLLNDDWCLCL